METFGERLKALQIELSPTQKDFAKRLGISPGSLSDLIKNNTSPSAETIYSLCRILFDTPDKLIWLLIGESSTTKSSSEPAIHLTAEAKQLVSIFDQLSIINQAKVIERSETLLSEQNNTLQQKARSSSNSQTSGEEAITIETA